VSLAVIERLGPTTPILGVCLGHQSIAQNFGASIVRADRLMHGRTSAIHHRGQGVFADLPSPLTATRYHSLIVKRETIPDELEVTAWTDQNEVMGIRHTQLPIEGVQFHPESFLTEHGHELIRNWLSSLVRGRAA
jgi:anthranilate synthase/aminodeoxychorismate synthase-like glutamine amidotransferase